MGVRVMSARSDYSFSTSRNDIVVLLNCIKVYSILSLVMNLFTRFMSASLIPILYFEHIDGILLEHLLPCLHERRVIVLT